MAPGLVSRTTGGSFEAWAKQGQNIEAGLTLKVVACDATGKEISGYPGLGLSCVPETGIDAYKFKITMTATAATPTVVYVKVYVDQRGDIPAKIVQVTVTPKRVCEKPSDGR